MTVPRKVERVFPAGPPAAIQVYTLAPETLLGWPRANRPEEREFLLPGVGERPELGRIAGRGGTANVEAVIAARPHRGARRTPSPRVPERVVDRLEAVQFKSLAAMRADASRCFKLTGPVAEMALAPRKAAALDGCAAAPRGQAPMQAWRPAEPASCAPGCATSDHGAAMPLTTEGYRPPARFSPLAGQSLLGLP